jgi:hypothetical protein
MATIKTKNGKVLIKDGKVSCECCETGYTLCIDNTNQILDNSWNVEINGNFIAYYDGSAFFNQCFDIPINFLNLNSGEQNTLNFNLAVCQSDDYFEFYILDLDEQEVYRSDSGFLNGSFFESETCTDTFFSRQFTL